MSDIHTPRPDVTIRVTITDADSEVLETLRDRAGLLDQTGILEHILNVYYDRLEVELGCPE